MSTPDPDSRDEDDDRDYVVEFVRWLFSAPWTVWVNVVCLLWFVFVWTPIPHGLPIPRWTPQERARFLGASAFEDYPTPLQVVRANPPGWQPTVHSAHGPIGVWNGEWWRLWWSAPMHRELASLVLSLLLGVWYGGILERHWGTLFYACFLALASVVSMLPDAWCGQAPVGFCGVWLSVCGALWTLKICDPRAKYRWNPVVNLLWLAAVAAVRNSGVGDHSWLCDVTGFGYGCLTAWLTVRQLVDIAPAATGETTATDEPVVASNSIEVTAAVADVVPASDSDSVIVEAASVPSPVIVPVETVQAEPVTQDREAAPPIPASAPLVDSAQSSVGELTEPLTGSGGAPASEVVSVAMAFSAVDDSVSESMPAQSTEVPTNTPEEPLEVTVADVVEEDVEPPLEVTAESEFDELEEVDELDDLEAVEVVEAVEDLDPPETRFVAPIKPAPRTTTPAHAAPLEIREFIEDSDAELLSAIEELEEEDLNEPPLPPPRRQRLPSRRRRRLSRPPQPAPPATRMNRRGVLIWLGLHGLLWPGLLYAEAPVRVAEYWCFRGCQSLLDNQENPDHWGRAVACDEHHVRAWLAWSIAYRTRGDHAAAWRILLHGLKRNPDSELLLQAALQIWRKQRVSEDGTETVAILYEVFGDQAGGWERQFRDRLSAPLFAENQIPAAEAGGSGSGPALRLDWEEPATPYLEWPRNPTPGLPPLDPAAPDSAQAGVTL